MTDVIIVRNILDDSENQRFYNVDDVCELLMQEFTTWPDTARVYSNYVSDEYEVDIACLKDIYRLQQLNGIVYVVVNPAWMVVTGIGLLIATVAIQFSGRKKSASAAAAADQRKFPESSPNNNLSARTNRERLNGRIPDIYGTVRSTPDLIAPSYRVFEGGSEVEHTLMAIGRGEYLIEDVREDKNLVEHISGSFAAFYGPGKSPINSTPDLTINGEYEEPFITAKRSTNVNDQVLLAPNAPTYNARAQYKVGGFGRDETNNNVLILGLDINNEKVIGPPVGSKSPETAIQTAKIVKPYIEYNKITRFENVSPADLFTGFFKPGDRVNLGGQTIYLYEITGFSNVSDGFGNTYRKPTLTTLATHSNINGQYKLSKVTDETMRFQNPEDDNSLFQTFLDELNAPTYDIYSFITNPYVSGTFPADPNLSYYLSLEDSRIGKRFWSIVSDAANTTITNATANLNGGPFIVEDADSILLNFRSAGGLYTDNGTTQTAKTVSLNVKVQPVDLEDEPIGSHTDYTVSIVGSAKKRDDVLKSFRQELVTPGRNAITVTRTTDLTTTSGVTASEEIVMTDLYEVKPIDISDFGNITIVRTTTIANSGTISQSQRKFNCRASRLIPVRQEDGTFSEPAPTSRFADIATAICLDPYIGNRSLAELDIDGWYKEYDKIEEYFGNPIFAEFNHTFDDEDLSFEETLAMVAEAVHCSVYRQGSLIKFNFERLTDNSLILFNHRNKIPNTETRSVIFGNVDEKDGVEVEYVDPKDGALVKFYLPEDRTSVNPEDVRMIGIQNKLQARIHAYRLWNKIRYQNTMVEFEATQEAIILSLNDRIQVADNSRTKTFDGEVIAQNGSTLQLSQPFIFEDGKSYTIFLQSVDATIQAIPIYQGLHDDEIILQSQTNLPLALDFDLYARATYEIIENSSTRKQAFLVDEKTPKDNFITTIRAINYDARYYANDKDFINAVVDENGNPIED